MKPYAFISIDFQNEFATEGGKFYTPKPSVTFLNETLFPFLNNGNVHRYVYYGCCRHKDPKCMSGYIREEELIEKLAGLMDEIDLDEIGMKEKIKEEIERHKRFSVGLLGLKETTAIKVKDVDIRNYAKHVLRTGGVNEKRELLGCLRSKIVMNNKKVSIE